MREKQDTAVYTAAKANFLNRQQMFHTNNDHNEDMTDQNSSTQIYKTFLLCPFGLAFLSGGVSKNIE